MSTEGVISLTTKTRFPLNLHSRDVWHLGCFGHQIGHPRFFVNHLITANVGFRIVIAMNMKNAGGLGLFRPIIRCCFQYRPIGYVRGYDGDVGTRGTNNHRTLRPKLGMGLMAWMSRDGLIVELLDIDRIHRIERTCCSSPQREPLIYI